MANRYWVGGTGEWNNSNTTNWSTSSGGSGGASVPTQNDYVIFDANSGTGTVTLFRRDIGYLPCAGLRKTTSNITFSLDSLTYGIQAYTSTTNTDAAKILDVSVGVNIQNVGTYIINCQNAGSGTYSITCSSTNSNVNLSVYAPSASSSTTIDLASSLNFASVSISDVIFRTNNYSITSTSNLNIGSGGTYETSITLGSSTLTSTTGIVNVRGNSSGTPIISAVTGIGIYRGASIGGSATLSSGSMEISAAGGGGAYYYGTATLSGGAFFSCDSSSSLGGTINFTGSNQTVTINPNTSGTLDFQGAGPYTLQGGGRVGTLTLRNNRTYTLAGDFGATTLNANGTTSGGMSITGSGGARTLTASSSFSLSNITWQNITAAGTIPFTGTGFVDGGSNTNIGFYVHRQSLFFAPNF